jgi:flagellar biosynthesis/type III secretory pathway protein FliH
MAGIIKRPPPRTGSAFSFSDVGAEAEAQRAQARREAEELLAKARATAAAEAKTERARAYEIGLAEGREAGREQALLEAKEEAVKAAAARLGEVEQAVVSIVQELEQRKHGLIADAVRDLLSLALALASRICKRTFEMQPGRTAAANLAAAVRQIGSGSRIVAHLHPDDLAEVEALMPSLVAAKEQLQHITFCAADDVTPGGCRVVVPHGCIDTQLETQLDALTAAILGDYAAEYVAQAGGDAAPQPSAFVPEALPAPVETEAAL